MLHGDQKQMKPKHVIIIVASIAIIAFALMFGFALGGGVLRVFSHDYNVEADNAGDSPQIIVNGGGNDVQVDLSSLPPQEKRSAVPTYLTMFLIFSIAVMSYWKVSYGKQRCTPTGRQ